jgi:hypothetical protein
MKGCTLRGSDKMILRNKYLSSWHAPVESQYVPAVHCVHAVAEITPVTIGLAAGHTHVIYIHKLLESPTAGHLQRQGKISSWELCSLQPKSLLSR